MNFDQIKPVFDAWCAEVKALLDHLTNIDQSRISEKVTCKIKVDELDSDAILDQVYSHLYYFEQELKRKDEMLPYDWLDYGFEPNSTDLPFNYREDLRYHIYIMYDRDLVEEAYSYEDGVLTLEIGFKLIYYFDGRNVSREEFIHAYGEFFLDYYCSEYDDFDDYEGDFDDEFDDPFDSHAGMVYIGDGVWCDDDGDNWDFD